MSSLNISINKSTLNLKNSYLDTHTWFLDYNDVKYLLWNAKYRQEFSIYNKFIKKIAIQTQTILRLTTFHLQLFYTCIALFSVAAKQASFIASV